MKITNILLTILIILFMLLIFTKLSTKTISTKSESIKIQPRKTKTVEATAKNKNKVKHSTTFKSYIDTDGRKTLGIYHNVRIGKDYYVSGGISTRESSFDNKEVSGQLSITKYW